MRLPLITPPSPRLVTALGGRLRTRRTRTRLRAKASRVARFRSSRRGVLSAGYDVRMKALSRAAVTAQQGFQGPAHDNPIFCVISWLSS